jgi:hypothetical protein
MNSFCKTICCQLSHQRGQIDFVSSACIQAGYLPFACILWSEKGWCLPENSYAVHNNGKIHPSMRSEDEEKLQKRPIRKISSHDDCSSNTILKYQNKISYLLSGQIEVTNIETQSMHYSMWIQHSSFISNYAQVCNMQSSSTIITIYDHVTKKHL